MQDLSLNVRDVRRRFDRAAASFSEAAFAHHTVADGIVERLTPFQAEPRTVIDLGSGPGYGATLLSKRYRRAAIIAVDLSDAMLREVEASRRWLSKIRTVQADATNLPFADRSIDLAYSNLLLPWISNPDPVFSELARVLKRDAPFVFSTLGPDSFANVVDAFADVDDNPRVNPFADMHDIGDGLVRAGLRDPVLDVDRLNIRYEDPKRFFADLTAAGARNALASRRRGLLGRRAFDDAVARLFADGSLTVTLEIVYGHAFGGGQSRGVFAVDANSVPVRTAKNS